MNYLINMSESLLGKKRNYSDDEAEVPKNETDAVRKS